MYNLIVAHSEQSYRKALLNVLPGSFSCLSEFGNASDFEKMSPDIVYDIILMQHNLPGGDTLITLQQIAIATPRPLILILCDSDDEIDRIVALELGADDCVAKSCSPREISARVRALIRRRAEVKFDYANHSEEIEKKDSVVVVKFGGWTLDQVARRLSSPSGAIVALTAVEYNILTDLIAHPGIARNRLDLRGMIHNKNKEPFDIRSMDVLVSRLRKKLSEHDPKTLIETVRGFGYRFTEDVAY